MIPGKFSYHAPASVPEAIALLGEYGEDAKVLAGGQSLIPLMRFRLAQPGHLVDINRIDGLAYVREDDGGLRIGALTREADLEAEPTIARALSAARRCHRGDRRSAGAQSGDGLRQCGPRRPGQ